MVIKMKKEDGGLKPTSSVYETIYKEFVKSIPNGQLIEVTLTPITGEGTGLQLSKLHASIRQIAKETGQDFDSVKLYIKEKAGFIESSSEGTTIKSFADMSKEELSSCIQATIELGDQLGIIV